MSALDVEPNTEEWLEERRRHIGASDAPAIMGLTPNWRSARDVAREKLETSPPACSLENKYLRRGQVLEPLVKALYTRQTGREIFAAPMYQHPDYEWMSATPDGWIIGKDLEALIECKTALRFKRHEWLDIWDNAEEYDIVPSRYWVQVQHQMAVTGESRVVVAVIFASDDLFDMLVSMLDAGREMEEVVTLAQDVVEFKIIEVVRDEEFIARLIEVEQGFWEGVEDGILPRELKYIKDSGSIRVANYAEENLLTAMKTAYLQKLLAEEDFDECCERVKQAIGEDSGIYSELIGKVTYCKPRARHNTDWKALAQDLLAKHVPQSEQERLQQGYTRKAETSRRLNFPYKYWKLN